MRDSRRARLILALLLLTAFTLITLDYRSGSGGPFRKAGNVVFGPIERAVSAVVDPIGSFFGSLGHLNSYKSENARLKKQNQDLLEQLRLTDADRAHLAAAEKLLNLAGRAQFRIVAAHVVGVGSGFGFEWTATIDVGSQDGVRRNQTVIDGDGLVGKTIEVGPTTSTILLADDPTFTAGARLEGSSQQIGTLDGARPRPHDVHAAQRPGADEGRRPAGHLPLVARSAVRARGPDRAGDADHPDTGAALQQGRGDPLRRLRVGGHRRRRDRPAPHDPA